jgi:uncharacterized membrane protein YkvA (DUF1232 family)
MVYDASIYDKSRAQLRYVMNLRKAVIGILVILYIISPYDVIPDFIFPVGWLDDLGILGLLIYYFKKGKLPGISSRRRESSEKKDI